MLYIIAIELLIIIVLLASILYGTHTVSFERDSDGRRDIDP